MAIHISASVLGLIFEKVNGYKEGSFYTPSFITMHMAREALENAVINKFNAVKGWKCESINDIYNNDIDIGEANQIINSIRVCDPAVGSGHFLVSVLNEFLRIKSELGVLVDGDGKRIKHTIRIENDELIVIGDDGEIFEYKQGSKEKTRIQQTFFREKQIIIENCLFGVDINPNSVNICRLRLWIELLKSAYYQDDGQLDTLPNIDINIHCGNSLISRFGLEDELSSKTIKAEVKEYKNKVFEYKENIGSKQAVMGAIQTIKDKFHQGLKSSHLVTMELNKRLGLYVKDYGFEGLTVALQQMALHLKFIQQANLFDVKSNQSKRKKDKSALDKALSVFQEMEYGTIYDRAFEWRFEFPEVLNDDGNFVGFDILIGNPPYVFARENFTDLERGYFNSRYALAVYQLNLYILFLECGTSLLRQNGCLAFIVPNNWLTINSARVVREFVLRQSNVRIVNFYAKVFEDANVDTSIVMYNRDSNLPIVKLFESNGDDAIQLVHETDSSTLLAERDAIINIASFRSDSTSTLVKKIESVGATLGSVAKVKSGLKAYEVGKGTPPQTKEMKDDRIYHSKHAATQNCLPYLEGRDVQRYVIEWGGNYLSYGTNLAAPRTFDIFSTPRILVRQIPSKPPYCIHACYVPDVMLNDINSMNIVDIKDDPLFVLGLLNSRLMTYWFVHKFGKLQRGIFPQFKVNELAQFPIVNSATDDQKASISKLVQQALDTKKSNPEADISALNTQIDNLVYKLYELSPDEIETIEADYGK